MEKEFIKITDLTRKFKENIALDSINLTIQEGELFGLWVLMELVKLPY